MSQRWQRKQFCLKQAEFHTKQFWDKNRKIWQKVWWLRWQGLRLRTERAWVQMQTLSEKLLLKLWDLPLNMLRLCSQIHEAINNYRFIILIWIWIVHKSAKQRRRCPLSMWCLQFPATVSGNRWLRNMQASISPFTDVQRSISQEGASKQQDHIKSLIVHVPLNTVTLC